MRLSQKISAAVLLLSLFICTLFPHSVMAGIVPAVQGNRVSIVGDNALSGEWVNVSVTCEDGKQAYIGQVMADVGGKYQFDFCLDKGKYNYSLSKIISGQGSILIDSSGSGSTSVPGEQKGTAVLTIRGDAERGTILASAVCELGQQYCSVLDFLKSVLDSKGIAYNIRGGYVVSIDGLAEKKPGYPMSGWLYSVNGHFPPVGADSYMLKNGDRVEWIYSLDGKEGMKEEIKLPATNEIKQLVDSYAQQLSGIKETKLLNLDQIMSNAEAAKLLKELKANTVALAKEVYAGSNYIADSAGEIAILIPDNALNTRVNITIQEGLKSFEEDGNIKFCSSVFDFGPDGTRFAVPITVALRIAVTTGLDVNALQPAWYDEQKKEWVPIPALIDLKAGIVMFRVDHFTSFAVIEGIKPNQVKPEPEHNFTDVGENYSWASEAITELAAKGIIKGTGNNCFEPQRAISRAEFMQMFATAMQLEKTTETKLNFKDVATDDWFADAVDKACSKNLIAGYPDGTFRPGKSINRYEVAVLLHRFYGQNASERETVFSDQTEIPVWALKAVNCVNGLKLMQGYEDKSFRGNNSLNRAEAACIVYRLLNR